jgi:hypothetical protein
MEATLENLFNLYVLSTGRRTFALQQMKPVAADLGQKALVTMINQALDHETKTLKLEARWEASGFVADPQRVRKVDAKVDRTLSAIRDTAQAQANAAETGDPLQATAQELIGQLFPAGVQAVSSMPYVEELAAVDTMLKQMKGALARHVADLGLERLMNRLAELAKEYREAQEEKRGSEVSFGDVRSARAIGHRKLLQIVAVILGTHYDDSAEDVRLRTALLTPMLEQQEAVRQYLKLRKPIEDIDPTTGEAKPASMPTSPAAIVDDN